MKFFYTKSKNGSLIVSLKMTFKWTVVRFGVNGGVREILDISTYDSDYVSLFITHFLNVPEKNLEILRKLYIDLKLSTRDIEKFTQSAWSKSSILRALKKHKIENMNENKEI